jgi:hypothetical protein
VNGLRRHQADAGMPVSGVVPGEEGVAVSPRILDATEAIREFGAVFEGLELRLGIRVVIGDVRAAVGLGDLQVEQPRWSLQKPPLLATPKASTQDGANCNLIDHHGSIFCPRISWLISSSILDKTCCYFAS